MPISGEVDAKIRKHKMLSRIPTRAASCGACSPPPEPVIVRPATVPQGHTPTWLAQRAELRAEARPDSSNLHPLYVHPGTAVSFSQRRPTGEMSKRRPLAKVVTLGDYAASSTLVPRR